MNEILWFITLVLSFTLLLVCYKFMGKQGLFMWNIIATLVTNIQTVKIVNLFGLETTLGNILYCSTFLSTNIINLKYGMKAANKATLYSFVSMILMTLFMGIALLYNPSSSDFASDSLEVIFSLNIRITLASLLAFALSHVNVTALFNKFQKGKNISKFSHVLSTIISQLIDTIVFVSIAYFGLISLETLIRLMLSMYIFKFIVVLCDSPFMYVANKIQKVRE